MIKAILFDFGLVISTPRPAACFRAYERDLGIARGSINRIMFDGPPWQDALIGRLTMQTYWRAIGPSLGLTRQRQIDAFQRRYYGDESVNPDVLNLIRSLHGTMAWRCFPIIRRAWING